MLVPGKAVGLAKPPVVAESDMVALRIPLILSRRNQVQSTHRKLWNSNDQSEDNCRRPLNAGAGGPRTVMVIRVVVVVMVPDDHVSLQSSRVVVFVKVVVRPLIEISYSTLRADRLRKTDFAMGEW